MKCWKDHRFVFDSLRLPLETSLSSYFTAFYLFIPSSSLPPPPPSDQLTSQLEAVSIKQETSDLAELSHRARIQLAIILDQNFAWRYIYNYSNTLVVMKLVSDVLNVFVRVNYNS